MAGLEVLPALFSSWMANNTRDIFAMHPFHGWPITPAPQGREYQIQHFAMHNGDPGNTGRDNPVAYKNSRGRETPVQAHIIPGHLAGAGVAMFGDRYVQQNIQFLASAPDALNEALVSHVSFGMAYVTDPNVATLDNRLLISTHTLEEPIEIVGGQPIVLRAWGIRWQLSEDGNLYAGSVWQDDALTAPRTEPEAEHSDPRDVHQVYLMMLIDDGAGGTLHYWSGDHVVNFNETTWLPVGGEVGIQYPSLQSGGTPSSANISLSWPVSSVGARDFAGAAGDLGGRKIEIRMAYRPAGFKALLWAPNESRIQGTVGEVILDMGSLSHTMEIIPPVGHADGRAQSIWSDANQRARAGGDTGLQGMRSYQSPLLSSFPAGPRYRRRDYIPD